jgi:predicted dehydrogenase
MERLKLAVIGCGAIAELKHFPSLARIPEVHVCSLVDVNPERANRIKQIFGLNKARITDSYMDAINEQVDAVLVLTPPKTHAAICSEALKTNKHVFCEKPLSTSLSDARKIVLAAEKSSSVFMLGYHYRFSKIFVKGKEISDQFLGNVHKVDTCFLSDVKKYEGVTNFRFEKDGGGAVLDQGPHVIDLLRWYLGDIKLVSAVTQNKDLNLPVEDTASLSLEFVDKEIEQCGVELSWASSGYKFELNLSGENGKMSVSDGLSRITLVLAKKTVFKRGPLKFVVSGKSNPYETELTHFFKSVIKGKKTSPNALDGFKNLSVLRAALQSAEKGEKIDLETWRS